MSIVGGAIAWLRKWRARILVGVGLPVGLALAWAVYYRHYDHVCRDKLVIAGCDRFVPMERFACDHGMGMSVLVGGCAALATRYELGMGVPKGLEQAIAFWRRGCVLDDGRSCTMAWASYGGAFSDPHFTIGWSSGLDAAGYRPNYARALDDVLADAEALCANDFEGKVVAHDRHDLLRLFCADLPRARAARDDARSHVSELSEQCRGGSVPACHLGGLLLTFGIGVKRDVVQGKELLKRACEQGNSLACYDLGREKDHPSPMLRELEAAIAAGGPG